MRVIFIYENETSVYLFPRGGYYGEPSGRGGGGVGSFFSFN